MTPRGRLGLVVGAIVVAVLAGVAGVAIGFALFDNDAPATGVEAQADALFDSSRSLPTLVGSTPSERAESATVTTTAGDTVPVTPDQLNNIELDLVGRLPADGLECETLRTQEEFADLGAAVGCADANGVVVAHFIPPFIQLEGNVDDIYERGLKRYGVSVDETDGRCPVDTPAEHEWFYSGTRGGRVACFRDSGAANLLWMHKPLQSVSIAIAPEGMTDAALYDWWSTRGQQRLDKEEFALLKSVPEDHRDSCEFSIFDAHDSPGVPRRKVDCKSSLGDPNDYEDDLGVGYWSFSEVDEMYHWYDEKRSWYQERTTKRDTGKCPDEVPAEHTWSKKGVVVGRLACNPPEGLGLSDMVWTTDRLKILASAHASFRDDASTSAELYEWWLQNGGPVSPSG